MFRVILAAWFLSVTPALAFSQTAASPAFEAASVKPGTTVTSMSAEGHKSTGSRIAEDPGRISYQNVTLLRIVARAYEVKARQIDGPAWLDTAAYDIAATIPKGDTKEQIPAMLRNLLAERFRIAVHVENKQERIYVLVVGKTPRLKEAKETEPSVSFDREGHMEFIGYTLPAFADVLTNLLDRPVSDSTGMQGRFDISTHLDMARLKPQAAPGSRDAYQPEAVDPAPSIFTAVQELGLKLEVKDGPVKHIVIDKAEKVPTAN